MRDYDQKLCSQLDYDLQKKNMMYLDQWFHVNISSIQKLSQDQQIRLDNMNQIMFLAKILYNGSLNDLVYMNIFAYHYSDSLTEIIPSRYQNYALSARETCFGKNNLENYDPRCRPWFVEANKTSCIYSKFLQLAFSTPFLQQSTFIIGIVANQRINDQNGNFLCMLSQNLALDHLKKRVFEPQDIYDEQSPQEGYSILLHKTNQTVYHHRYWKPENQQLKTWIDLEYNSSTYYLPEEKQQFGETIKKINTFALQSNYSIENRTNTEQFFFKFRRNNNTYLGLIYPVIVTSIENPFKLNITQIKPMLVGRIIKDRTRVLEEVTLAFLPLNDIIIKCEVGILILWVFLNLLRYTFFLYNSTELPLSQLIQAIKENTVHIKQQNKNLNKSIVLSQFKKNLQTDENNIRTPKASLCYPNINIYGANHEVFSQGDNLTIQQNSINNLPPIKAFQKSRKDLPFNEEQSSNQLLLNRKRYSQFEQSARYQTANSIAVNDDRLNSLESTTQTFNQIELKEKKVTDIQKINARFLEMKIIINSIKGIFNLLQLAKINDEQGNNDISILQFASALKIFVKVKNFDQQIICYKQIGNQYLKQQRYIEAEICYKSIISILMQQLQKTTYDEILDQINKGVFTPEEKQLFYEFAVILKMLTISLKEQILMNKEQKEYLVNECLNNILLSSRIFRILKNESLNSELFLCKYIELEILAIKDNKQCLNKCDKIIEKIESFLRYSSITDLIIDRNKSSLRAEQRATLEILYQHIVLLKSKIQIIQGKLHNSTDSLTSLLESSEYLDEYVKYETLSILKNVFLNADIIQSDHINQELEKYNVKRIRFEILIDITASITEAEFYNYLQMLNIFFKIYLIHEDSISFTVFGEDILQINQNYRVFQEEFTRFTIKQLVDLFKSYQKQKKNKKSTNNWIDAWRHILIMHRAEQIIDEKRNQKYNFSKMQQPYEENFILIFSFNNVEIYSQLDQQEINSKITAHLNALKQRQLKYNIFHVQNICDLEQIIQSNKISDNYNNIIKKIEMSLNDNSLAFKQSSANNNNNTPTSKQTKQIRLKQKSLFDKNSFKQEEYLNNSYSNLRTKANSIVTENPISLLIESIGHSYKCVNKFSVIQQEINKIRYQKPLYKHIYYY